MRPLAGSAGSLGARLSHALALQIFIGLALISIVVYLMISEHLLARQTAALSRLEAFVAHLVDEARQSGDAEAFDHMLEDFLLGHDDLALELRGERGIVRYGGPVPDGPAATGRRRDFRLPSPTRDADGERETLEARLALDTSADDTLLARLAWTLGITSLLGAVAGSLGAAWRVRRGLEPLAELDRQLRELDAANLSSAGTRLSGEAQPAELQPLIARFNELLDRLDGVHGELRAFNANVAHELKTPLATLVSTTELGLRGSDGAAALRELLASNLEELERLDGVVRGMLFLATAERGTRARASAIPSLAALARDVIEYHEAVFEEAGLTARVTGEAAIEGDAMLLRQALSNLLSNASRHAAPDSTVDIAITADTFDGAGEVRLAVTNIGESVAAAQLGRLFERFYRIEPSRSASPETGGASASRHGLGLPIVAAIARMHRGTTFAESGDGRTTIGFTLSRRRLDLPIVGSPIVDS